MWTKEEIVCSYRTARNKEEQIEILAELAQADIDTIVAILEDAGEKLPDLMKRFKLCADCGCLITRTGRHKRCDECQRNHDRERRRLRYHKMKEGKNG